MNREEILSNTGRTNSAAARKAANSARIMSKREYLHPRYMRDEIDKLLAESRELGLKAKDRRDTLCELQQKRADIAKQTQRANLELMQLVSILRQLAKERKDKESSSQNIKPSSHQNIVSNTTSNIPHIKSTESKSATSLDARTSSPSKSDEKTPPVICISEIDANLQIMFDRLLRPETLSPSKRRPTTPKAPKEQGLLLRQSSSRSNRAGYDKLLDKPLNEGSLALFRKQRQREKQV